MPLRPFRTSNNLKSYAKPHDLDLGVNRIALRYNAVRPHYPLNGLTPDEAYRKGGVRAASGGSAHMGVDEKKPDPCDKT